MFIVPIVKTIGATLNTTVRQTEPRDPRVGGGYVVLPNPGTTDGFVPMPYTPVGDIHWAGSETASDHPGYLDGAIEAGQQAANEVVEALGRR